MGLANLEPLLPWRLRPLHRLYTGMAYFAVTLFVLYQFGLTWAWTVWLTRLMNCLFFIRVVIVILQGYRQDFLASFVETWLMVHMSWEKLTNTVLFGYDFLALARFGYPLIQQDCGKHRKLLWRVLIILVAMTVMAGMLEFVDETKKGKCVREVSPDMISFSYIYMMIVSISTVGYGELKPILGASKVLACLLFVTTIVWFQKRIGGIVRNVIVARKVIPAQSCRPRAVLLWNGTTRLLSCFLKRFLEDQDSEVLIISESEEIEEIDEVPVFCRTITPSLLKKLFRLLDSERGDRIIIMNTEEMHDASLADSKVFALVEMAKIAVPHVPVVVHVRLGVTREAVENLPQWSLSDSVVCTADLVESLVEKTVIAAGAASVLCNIITPRHHKRTGQVGCLQWVVNEYLWGENLTLCSSLETFPNEESFTEAACKSYRRGIILLGCWDSEFRLLPEVLPAGTHRVYLAPPKYVRDKKWLKVDSIPEVPESYIYGAEELFVINNKREVVLCDAHGNCKPVSGVNSKSSSSVWVVRKRCSASNYEDLTSYQLAWTKLKKMSPESRLVTNIPHSLPHRLDDVISSPFWRQNYVNEDIVTSAVRYAHQFHMLYGIWMELLEKGTIVEVTVQAQCSYGSLFHSLINRRLLPLGACVRVDGQCCTECKSVYEISSPFWMPIISSAAVALSPGDTIITLQIGTPPC